MDQSERLIADLKAALELALARLNAFDAESCSSVDERIAMQAVADGEYTGSTMATINAALSKSA